MIWLLYSYYVLHFLSLDNNNNNNNKTPAFTNISIGEKITNNLAAASCCWSGSDSSEKGTSMGTVRKISRSRLNNYSVFRGPPTATIVKNKEYTTIPRAPNCRRRFPLLRREELRTEVFFFCHSEILKVTSVPATNVGKVWRSDSVLSESRTQVCRSVHPPDAPHSAMSWQARAN